MSKVLTYNSTSFANWLAGTIIVLVPFHAFLTVWASTFTDHYVALRLWDEVLLGILVFIAVGWLICEKALRTQLFSSRIFRLIIAYLLVTLALGCVALSKNEVTYKALGYGLIVNLRFLVWFLAVWLAASRSDWLHYHWKRLFFWPLAVVSVFAIVQFSLLPHDFLTHFGYNKTTTIAPFSTINQNTETIRAQSFLRGPNPLGAYLALGLGLLAAICIYMKRRWQLWVLGLVVGLALFLSFSRSAWIGAFVAVVAAAWLHLKPGKQRTILAATLAVVVIAFAGSFALFRSSSGVQDALLHVHAGSTAHETSNAGHASAFRSGVRDIVHEPFGRGPGTAGPASVYNGDHGVRNSESYYLQIGQELGWAGLILFVAINLTLGLELWRRRSAALAIGLLATLVGLTIVNQFAYAWADDTLAYLFWGLAGIALAQSATRPETA